jgi:hypothetical protein
MNLRLVGAVLLCAVTATAAPGAQKPALDDLLARAAEYHDSLTTRASGATLDEHYIFTQVTAGRMHTPMHFRSDVVLLNVNGRVIGLRDPYALDNVPLRERKPRIVELLREPTLSGWDRAQKHAAESHFRFISDIVIALNDPAVALRFISREMQPKLTWKFEGMKKLDGVELASVGFRETGTRQTRYSLETRGNAAASGRFFIDPSTGSIRKTELWVNSDTEAVVTTVTYSEHKPLDLWLPQKMMQNFEWKEMHDVKSNRDVGAYGARLFFQANATYSDPQYTPIDLTKMRR